MRACVSRRRLSRTGYVIYGDFGKCLKSTGYNLCGIVRRIGTYGCTRGANVVNYTLVYPWDAPKGQP